jgi:hypothetical protein
MVRVKLFDSSSIGFLENAINQYLQDLDPDDLVDIKITSVQRENVSPSVNYVAMIILKH